MLGLNEISAMMPAMVLCFVFYLPTQLVAVNGLCIVDHLRCLPTRFKSLAHRTFVRKSSRSRLFGGSPGSPQNYWPHNICQQDQDLTAG
jgi:hypothetical protein